MGVMACFRNGCKNIMCDRYSHEFGYICNDCFSELVDILISQANSNNNPRDVIKKFMALEKCDTYPIKENLWEYADGVFPREESSMYFFGDE
jgi:hypothetical protein